MSDNTCLRVFANIEQIDNCKKVINENNDQFKKLSNALGLAGNEVRFKILFLLQKEGKMCPCDLSDILQMTVPAISQHLKKLRDGNLIVSKKVATTVFYSLNHAMIDVLNPVLSVLNYVENE